MEITNTTLGYRNPGGQLRPATLVVDQAMVEVMQPFQPLPSQGLRLGLWTGALPPQRQELKLN